MSTRREFLTDNHAPSPRHPFSWRSPNQKAVPKPLNGAPNVTRQAGSPIKKVICREETTLRLGGHGAEWHMSWAADDRQFVSLGGGMGWSIIRSGSTSAGFLPLATARTMRSSRMSLPIPTTSSRRVGKCSTGLHEFRYVRSGRAHLSVSQHARTGTRHAEKSRSERSLFILPTTGAPGAIRMGQRR